MQFYKGTNNPHLEFSLTQCEVCGVLLMDANSVTKEYGVPIGRAWLFPMLPPEAVWNGFHECTTCPGCDVSDEEGTNELRDREFVYCN
jgi:hypothetical protein